MTSPLVERVALTEAQHVALERLLGRMVVEPRLLWIPIGVTGSRPDPHKPVHNAELERWMRKRPGDCGEFTDAWKQLEAQTTVLVSNGQLPLAVSYIRFMLRWYARSDGLLWEGPRGASRAWVRTRRGKVLPLPLNGAVERALDAWWGLSGGFYNRWGSLLKVPRIAETLPHLPFYRKEDRETLHAHPSSLPFEDDEWNGRLPGASIVDGVQIIGGEPARGRTAGKTLWSEDPLQPWGYRWLDQQKDRLNPATWEEARTWRQRQDEWLAQKATAAERRQQEPSVRAAFSERRRTRQDRGPGGRFE